MVGRAQQTCLATTYALPQDGKAEEAGSTHLQPHDQSSRTIPATQGLNRKVQILDFQPSKRTQHQGRDSSQATHQQGHTLILMLLQSLQ